MVSEQMAGSPKQNGNKQDRQHNGSFLFHEYSPSIIRQREPQLSLSANYPTKQARLLFSQKIFLNRHGLPGGNSFATIGFDRDKTYSHEKKPKTC
ncbi:MAG TPA: hypothetical protein VF451_02960 [Acidobacteriota bacterium]